MMKKFVIFFFVFFVSISLSGCNEKPYEISTYLVSETYSNYSNTVLSLNDISVNDDNKVSYSFSCFFGDEMDATRFELDQFWFKLQNDDDYFIVGNDVAHGLDSSYISYVVNDIAYDTLDECDFLTDVEYSIIFLIDYQELCKVFDCKMISNYNFESTQVRFMISCDETILFVN